MPTFPPTPPTERLERYVKAEAKYVSAPVPTPMSRAVVGGFVATRLLTAGTFGEMDKLGALACFYELRDAAGLFVKALGPGLGAADAVKRWARALRAAAWLAGPDHREAVLKSVPVFLERADPRRHREDVLDTLDMVGSTVSDAGTVGGQFTAWLDVRRLDRIAEDLRRRPGTEDEQDEVRRDTLSLREFRDAYASQLPIIVAAKTANRDQAADAPRIGELARMYLALAERRNPRYYAWSALGMLRLAGVTEPLPPVSVPAAASSQPDQAEKLRRQRRAAVADALFGHAASRREDVEGADRQHERSVRRARALRAADYFGHPLTPDDRVWLGLQKDDGTDILALRPDWEYPLPCCGNEQRSAPAKR